MAATVINFATGVPRITNKGLLVEEARTNLLLRSQEFDNATWGKNAAPTVTANAAVAPDGTTTADTIATTTVSQGVLQTVTVANATVHTWSVFVDLVSGSGVLVIGSESTPAATLTFDPATGVISSPGAGLSASSAEQLASGWWRVRGTYTSASTADTVIVYAGDSVAKTFAVWGAQLEAGAFATSYIPTTSASATRAIDVAAVTSIPTPSAGYTLYVEFAPIGFGVSNQALVQFDDGTQSNRSFIFIATSGLLTHLCQTGGVTQANDLIGGSAVTVGTVCKAALRVEANNFRGAVNGALGTLDASGTIPTAPTVFRPGTNSAGATPANSYIKRAQLIPRALSDAELQALTA